MKNIFKFELKMILKSALIWCVVMVFGMWIFLSLFSTVASDAEIIESILEHYPEEMLKVLGMTTALPLSSVLGYLVFTFAFIQLFFAIQASYYGFSILSVEEREFTADYLMAKPVSRYEILNAKIISGLIALLVTTLVTASATLALIEMYKGSKTYEFDKLMILFVGIILFQLSFYSLGLFISVAVKKVRNVLSYALGLSFGTYTINGIRAVIGGDLMGYITPFSHYEPGSILVNGSLDGPYTLISVSLMVVCFIMTYVLYSKRDIHAL